MSSSNIDALPYYDKQVDDPGQSPLMSLYIYDTETMQPGKLRLELLSMLNSGGR